MGLWLWVQVTVRVCVRVPSICLSVWLVSCCVRKLSESRIKSTQLLAFINSGTWCVRVCMFFFFLFKACIYECVCVCRTAEAQLPPFHVLAVLDHVLLWQLTEGVGRQRSHLLILCGHVWLGRRQGEGWAWEHEHTHTHTHTHTHRNSEEVHAHSEMPKQIGTHTYWCTCTRKGLSFFFLSCTHTHKPKHTHTHTNTSHPHCLRNTSLQHDEGCSHKDKSVDHITQSSSNHKLDTESLNQLVRKTPTSS